MTLALAPLPLRQLITIVNLTGSGYISGTVHAFLSLRKKSALLVLPRVEPELFQLELSAWQPAS